MLAALRIVARRLLIALAIVAIIVPSVVTLWAISADSHDLLDLAVTKTESIDPEVAGSGAGAKRARAEALNISILGEADFLAFLSKHQSA